MINALVYRMVGRKLKFLQAEERVIDGKITSVAVSPPENAEQLKGIWNPARFWGNYTTKPIVLFTVRQGFLSQEGVVYKGVKLLKEALVYPNFEKSLKKSIYSESRLKKQLRQILYHVWDHCSAQYYFHWLLDTLPRMAALNEHEERNKLLIALTNNLPAYVRESLTAFSGIWVVFFDEKDRVMTRMLHAASSQYCLGLAPPKHSNRAHDAT